MSDHRLGHPQVVRPVRGATGGAPSAGRTEVPEEAYEPPDWWYEAIDAGQRDEERRLAEHDVVNPEDHDHWSAIWDDEAHCSCGEVVFP